MKPFMSNLGVLAWTGQHFHFHNAQMYNKTQILYFYAY